LEAGDFDTLPSVPQARGFLRTYASYLGLDAQSLLQELNGNSPAPAAPSPPPVPVERPAEGPTQADAIFVEVGQRLQRQRELLGLSLDDVIRHTHLRQHYLVALESGNIKSLPSPVQGRGMLNNYATFLGLDPEPLLLRFADGLQAGLVEKQGARRQPRPAPAPSKSALPLSLRRLLSPDYLIGGTLALFLVGFVFWGAIRIFSLRAEETPSPTAPSIADVLLAVPAEIATATPTVTQATQPPAVAGSTEPVPTGEEGTAPAATPPPGEGGGVQVYITVHQRAWLRAIVDGEVEFDGRVLPGSAYSFAGEEQVEILTGNAAALQVFFNQQDLGALGSFGQVINRIYTVQGIALPTPSVTPTATPTPRTTPTSPSTAAPPGGTQPVTTPIPAIP
jgi:cytoskeletal protein RodZ